MVIVVGKSNSGVSGGIKINTAEKHLFFYHCVSIGKMKRFDEQFLFCWNIIKELNELKIKINHTFLKIKIRFIIIIVH